MAYHCSPAPHLAAQKLTGQEVKPEEKKDEPAEGRFVGSLVTK